MYAPRCWLKVPSTGWVGGVRQAEEQRLVAALHAAQQAQDAMIEDADGHSSELAWQLSEANQQNTQLSMYINMANQRVMQLEQQVQEAVDYDGLVYKRPGPIVYCVIYWNEACLPWCSSN